MQTVGTVYPELNLKRRLLEKVSEDKRDGVGAETSINTQGAVNKAILAQSSSVCQEAISAGVHFKNVHGWG
jgi:hypothetical protein